jgi:hypothetical protein
MLDGADGGTAAWKVDTAPRLVGDADQIGWSPG